MAVFWKVTPCHMVETNRRTASDFNTKADGIHTLRNAGNFIESSILKLEEGYSSKTPVNFSQSTRYHNPTDDDP